MVIGVSLFDPYTDSAEVNKDTQAKETTFWLKTKAAWSLLDKAKLVTVDKYFFEETLKEKLINKSTVKWS